MKAIIDGFRYDTDKAIKVGSADANCPRSDFSWWEATLYETPRSSNFFLAGEGGPMTQFGRRVNGNMRGYGERIIPMSGEEAYAWAEGYLTTDEIEAAFGNSITDA